MNIAFDVVNVCIERLMFYSVTISILVTDCIYKMLKQLECFHYQVILYEAHSSHCLFLSYSLSHEYRLLLKLIYRSTAVHDTDVKKLEPLTSLFSFTIHLDLLFLFLQRWSHAKTIYIIYMLTENK